MKYEERVKDQGGGAGEVFTGIVTGIEETITRAENSGHLQRETEMKNVEKTCYK